MIVAYPIELDVQNPLIGLVDISTETIKKFRKEVQDFKPIQQTYIKNSLSRSATFTDSLEPLEVHEVGNYLISVVMSYSELHYRLDWKRFTKPSDFELRIKTLLNPKLYPPTYKWFYVVASAVKNIKDDGFGVVYPRLSSDLLYFPTAHEQRQNNSTNTDYSFDYELYGYSLREKSDAQITIAATETKVNDSRDLYFNNKGIIKPLDKLKNLEFFNLQKRKLKLNPDFNVGYLSIITKNGKDDNHNWFL
jgi:hypothetical protein